MAVSAREEPYFTETTGGDEAPVVSARSVAMPMDDEATLVDAAVEGDSVAFAALYDRHLARVYRHCYYRTSNRADAEDLTQQTFLQAWQAIGRYRRGASPFIAWLLTISQNLAMSHHRKAREIATSDLQLVVTEEAADPTAALSTALMRDEVRAAILRLRPERQQVILLRFIEGFSVAEVAAVLGKTENNTRVIQHRALADLRRLLAGLALEDDHGPGVLADRVRGAISAMTERVTTPRR